MIFLNFFVFFCLVCRGLPRGGPGAKRRTIFFVVGSDPLKGGPGASAAYFFCSVGPLKGGSWRKALKGFFYLG